MKTAQRREPAVNSGASSANPAGIVTKTSPRSVDDTVARFTEILGSKGMKVFAVIDQRAEARRVGL